MYLIMDCFMFLLKKAEILETAEQEVRKRGKGSSGWEQVKSHL